MTDQQAQCYLNRYDDLKNAFGSDLAAAKKHYAQFGEKEKREPRCADTTVAQSCLSTSPEDCPEMYNATLPVVVANAYDNTTFSCNGITHMTKVANSPKRHQETNENFVQTNLFQEWVRTEPVSHQKCDSSLMSGVANGRNLAELTEYARQCWCEPIVRMEPRMCAKEGGTCKQCNGNVLYGIAKNGTRAATWSELMSTNYVSKKQSGSDIACSNAAMGSDPQPGVVKQCFCDDAGIIPQQKIDVDYAFFANERRISEEEAAAALASA